jgi:hypothetical protein
MTSLRHLLLAAALPLALLGCGGGGDDDAGPAVTDAERRQGAELHPQLLAEFGGAYRAPEAQYLGRIGEKVAGAAGLEGQCTFTLVNSNVVNAFAVPGCYIYVTRGLMGIINSEAEFASVLAHEVGHIVGNHSEQQQKRSLWRNLGVAALGVLTGSDRLAGLAGEAAAFFGCAIRESTNMRPTILACAICRPPATIPMRHRRCWPRWGATRPSSTARAARMRPNRSRMGAHPSAYGKPDRPSEGSGRGNGVADDELPEHAARYLAEVDGLLYGDDPEQGFVLGRRFAHPVMRIGFEAPEGFTLTNSPQAIMIDGRRPARGIRRRTDAQGGLPAYAEGLLSQMLGKADARAGTPQPTRVNGLPALFVPVSVATQQGAVTLSLMAYPGAAAEPIIPDGIAARGRPPLRSTPCSARSACSGLREAAQLRPRQYRSSPQARVTPFVRSRRGWPATTRSITC